MVSRICFGLLLNSNIDKNNVIIKRNPPKKVSYQKNFDDWDISQEIVNKYKYDDRCNLKYLKSKLSQDKFPIFKEFDNLIFGNTKLCDYTTCILSQPVFHITGIYGDRNHLGDIIEINNYLNHKKRLNSKDMKKEDIKLLSDYMDKYANIIFKKYESKNKTLYLGDFLSEYINRFYGIKITSKIFQNDVLISPFTDSSIHKIQVHIEGSSYYYTLPCLIYIRYFEGLIDFKFQTDSKPRIISEEEITFAKKQCEKFPFQKINYDLIPNLTDKKKIIYNTNFLIEKVKEILEKRLKDNEEQFVKIFGKEYLELGLRDLKKENIRMQNYMTPIVAICSILNKLKKQVK